MERHCSDYLAFATNTGLAVTVHDATATLRLSRPERGNALCPVLVDAIVAALDWCVAQADLHTVVLRADGPDFCTGFDLSDAAQATDPDLLVRFVRVELMLQRLSGVPLRTVALVQGRAFGAGAYLVAACDVRLALPDARFRFPGPRFGIVLGTRRLVTRIGFDNAHRITASGEVVNAQCACDLGLVTDLASGDPAEVLASLPPIEVDRDTLARLLAGTRPRSDDTDLAELVRSAARPGLANRLRAYVARTKAERRAMTADNPSRQHTGERSDEQLLSQPR